MSASSAVEGILAVWKPRVWSSNRVVERIQALVARASPANANDVSARIRVGHGGTLDPEAVGILIIGIGKSSCKLLNDFLKSSKTYEVEGEFGAETDSYELSGRVLVAHPEGSWKTLTHADLHRVMSTRFTGAFMQRPPLFSALHINGERAYKVARRMRHKSPQLQSESSSSSAGVDGDQEMSNEIIQTSSSQSSQLELPPRSVTCHSWSILHFTPPRFRLRVDVSSGFYIRSLIHDIGRELQTGASVVRLSRTCHYGFTIDEALGYPGAVEYETTMTESPVAASFSSASSSTLSSSSSSATIDSSSPSPTLQSSVGHQIDDQTVTKTTATMTKQEKMEVKQKQKKGFVESPVSFTLPWHPVNWTVDQVVAAIERARPKVLKLERMHHQTNQQQQHQQQQKLKQQKHETQGTASKAEKEGRGFKRPSGDLRPRPVVLVDGTQSQPKQKQNSLQQQQQNQSKHAIFYVKPNPLPPNQQQSNNPQQSSSSSSPSQKPSKSSAFANEDASSISDWLQAAPTVSSSRQPNKPNRPTTL